MNLIKKNFNRISFHDSHLSRIGRFDNLTVLSFDFVWIENYSEKGIVDDFYANDCSLVIKGIFNETIELNFAYSIGYEKMDTMKLTFDEVNIHNCYVIMNHEIDEEGCYLIISSWYYYDSILCELNWRVNYESLVLEWKEKENTA